MSVDTTEIQAEDVLAETPTFMNVAGDHLDHVLMLLINTPPKVEDILDLHPAPLREEATPIN